MSPLHSLSYAALVALAEAIESHRLCFPFLPNTLDSYLLLRWQLESLISQAVVKKLFVSLTS
jgi:hypothetical protein